MSPTHADLAEAFSRHHFDVVHPHLADGDNFVVVDSRAEYTGDDEPPARVASCDVYRFAGETLVEITSYTVAV